MEYLGWIQVTNIDDISCETGELIVASPKPRLSGYFWPGLKSTLSQSKSRTSRYTGIATKQ